MTSAERIWTIGHSTHDLESFVALLAMHDIAAIADVRRFPGSRRHPHFASDALRESLAERGRGYHWFPSLGGRRSGTGDTGTDSAWTHPAFRAYAEHIHTPEFAEGVHALLDLAALRRTAILCSEAVWWRCHRRLISDVLVVRGLEVLHIFPDGRAEPHRIRPPARLLNGALTYAPEGQDRPDPADQTAVDS